MGEKPNILAGSVSSGFDAPRVAGNCPNPKKLLNGNGRNCNLFRMVETSY